MAGKDYYSILGVSRNAADKEIKQAYRRLARQYHPDINPGNKQAEEKFKLINEAYEVISDTEKRKKYDQYGENWKHADQFAQAGTRGGSPFGQSAGGPEYVEYNFGDSGGAGSPFGDVFEDLLGRMGAGRRTPRRRRGEDAEFPLEITLEEAYSGAVRTIQVEGEEICQVCNGRGALKNAPCYTCGGMGRVVRPRKLEVKIPAGVKTGSRVRIAGGGGPGAMGGEKGDLYLLITVRPHQLFDRKDDDLHIDVNVPLHSVILGGEVEVSTLKGKAVLKIPPETQNGRVFRLTGLGMPHLGDSNRGDLYARVEVVLPQDLTEREKELFRELRRLRPS